MRDCFKTIEHRADLCIVGGGLSGMCAAVSAARHGAKVALMQDRPMLGGNASSEIRMWVCGAHGENNLETGLLEEIMMENQYRNPNKNYSIWDGVLYEIVKFEPNIELILNCSCQRCEMDGRRVTSVTGWQLTTQQYHRVEAKLFADCSGDSVLAPLTGADFRMGREARAEFGEDIEPEVADTKTMGMSCMLQAREESAPSEFIPPKWAHTYAKDDLPYRVPDMSNPSENFWYIELGGDRNSIDDTEEMRDELLKVAYGMWDFVKNDPENKEKNKNWRLDWMGILPGKRESRRYLGDHILTQNDVRAEGRFDDLVAYGGWTMDDHHPSGFQTCEKPTIFHPAPSPYGIPYRCLYSRNVDNLFCAGRNISVTHAALSSTRVMATCALVGQAAGTAAAIAVREGIDPRGVYEGHIAELKQTLMEDDCYLPFTKREIPELTAKAKISGCAKDAENLRNGIDRPIGDRDNGAMLEKGAYVEYDFGEVREISHVRIIFDSDLNRITLKPIGSSSEPWKHNMIHNRPLNMPDLGVPATMTKAYRIEGVGEDGVVRTLYEADNNYQRLNAIDLFASVRAVRLVPTQTWGAEKCHIFSFDAR